MGNNKNKKVISRLPISKRRKNKIWIIYFRFAGISMENNNFLLENFVSRLLISNWEENKNILF